MAHVDESISTLRFASRAKNIANKPIVNEVISDGTLLKRYREEISTLKQQLESRTPEADSNELDSVAQENVQFY